MRKLFMAIFFIFLLFSCTDYSAYHEVTYTITGTVSKAKVSYIGEYGLVEAGICDLPWQFSFYAKPNSYLYISAENMADTGNIIVSLIDDGNENSKADMSPYGKVTLSKQL